MWKAIYCSLFHLTEHMIVSHCAEENIILQQKINNERKS